MKREPHCGPFRITLQPLAPGLSCTWLSGDGNWKMVNIGGTGYPEILTKMCDDFHALNYDLAGPDNTGSLLSTPCRMSAADLTAMEAYPSDVAFDDDGNPYDPNPGGTEGTKCHIYHMHVVPVADSWMLPSSVALDDDSGL